MRDVGRLNWQSETTPISGLQPDTAYHYRIVATNTAGTLPGNDSVFTTPGPPVAITGSAANMQETQATLGGEVNPLGFGDAEYYFEYMAKQLPTEWWPRFLTGTRVRVRAT